jgi:hypothetical protein
MLRITAKKTDTAQDLIVLEGKLVGPWVDELRGFVSTAMSSYVLEVSNLSYADSEGVRLLDELLDRGVQLSSGKSFVASLLSQAKS